MRQKKQSKIMVIVALCVSVIGLTLGFAAFSNTLTISSSATVSPNESDFNINVYGIENWTADYPTYDMFTSDSVSEPRLGTGSKSATTAKISDNGKAITISDLSAEMVEPSNDVTYSFLIKNEGEYTAYLDTTLFDEMYSGIGGQCTPGDDTTKELVDDACSYISMVSWFEASDGSSILTQGDYELAKGDYIILTIVIGYSDVTGVVRADGDFSVAFDDINLEFTSVPSGE